MITALAIVSAVALHAQVADTAVFPPAPSTVPFLRVPPDAADSGFGTWRRTPIPRHDKTPAAWTLRAGNWDFLMGTPRAMDAMDSSQIIDTTLANCRKPLNISAEDSAKFAVARPWAPFDSLADDRPVLVISIMPVLRNFTECGFKNLGRPAMIRRGMRFVTEFQYDPSRDPTSAVVLSRLRIVKATMLATAPVMVMSKGGVPAQTTSQLRLYIPYDAIAPLPSGDMPQVELLIWTKAGGEPHHIVLPSNILHTVWWEYLRWRSVRLAQRDKATMATPVAQRRVIVKTPAPSDTGLKTALRRQREGRDAEATSIILERLTDDKISTNDRRAALMSLASTFQADDDLPSAALVANELTAMDPCALSGGENVGGAAVGNAAYTGMRAAGALLDHTRSGVRCWAYKPGVTFLRGLIPGYGQYKTWSHLIGLSDGALTATLAYTSYSLMQSGNNWYARSQAEKSRIATRYDSAQAVSQRNSANLLAIWTGVLWIGSAIEAEWQERVHASRLAAVHEFWFRPILTTAPGSSGTAPGLAGGLRFEFR
jgi:hypothetical protein